MSVLEIALFQFKSGVTEDQVKAALSDSDRWLGRQPGFVSRRHGASAEGRMDIVEWSDSAAARAAAEAFMAAPEACGLMSIIDPGTVVMRHFDMLA